jgi:multidrug efflux pump subunit AcrA (membrane-fusion protein)
MAVISKDKFKIETNVPEADIAKVGVGNVANVSLDAYGRDTIFPTKVIAIDPAETVIDGVSTYKVTLQFITEDERIKSGMTANIDIVTAKKEGILAIPQRALIRKDGIRIVRVLVEKEIEERKVETGIVGFDGFIEILSGLKEGETIVVFSDN